MNKRATTKTKRDARPSDNGAERAARRKATDTRAQAAARKLAILAARTAAEDKCEEILALDLRGMSPICDFFVIATGTSDRQMRAVADHIEAEAARTGERPYRVSGREDGTWIVIDFVDTVVHLFDTEHRRYYDLEMLWGDAPRVNWQRATRRKPAEA